LKNKFLIITLIVSIFLLISVNAAVVGVSPSIIRFKGMLKGGYAENIVTASTSFPTPLNAHLTAEGDIAEWVTYAPEDKTFVFSRDSPYSFAIIMEPPVDTANGNYSGIIKITTDELAEVESGAGSSVIAQVGLLIYVEVIGDEITMCRAGAISTLSSEVGDPFIIQSTIHNDGNVRLRPQIQIDVLNQLKTETLFDTQFFGSQILPTRDKQIIKEIEHNLPVGQYFANIYFPECGVTKLTTFDILEKGQISDSGTLIGIKTNNIVNKNELVPIAPIFRNLGSRKVTAQFKGEIRSLKKDKIEQVLESETLEVNPGETVEFRMFFLPQTSGDYRISGRVKYNNKITFDEQSKVITVIGNNFSWIFYLFGYLIIGLIILILIGNIKKAKRKRRKRIF